MIIWHHFLIWNLILLFVMREQWFNIPQIAKECPNHFFKKYLEGEQVGKHHNIENCTLWLVLKRPALGRLACVTLHDVMSRLDWASLSRRGTATALAAASPLGQSVWNTPSDGGQARFVDRSEGSLSDTVMLTHLISFQIFFEKVIETLVGYLRNIKSLFSHCKK